MRYFACVLLLVALSCTTKKTETSSEPAMGPEPEAYSLAGKPLFAKSYDSTTMAKADSAITAIQAKGELTEDDFVNIGRSLVATGRYLAAIANYTDGLRKYPDSFKLLRHRGHRYLSTRQWEKAIVDLSRAEELIRSQPDVWEYDAKGKPSATYQHQIWYHLGLYHYLIKSYEEAAKDYEKSVAAAKEPANIVGATDWLYNCYQRSGQKDKAENVIKSITPDYPMEDKDHAYFRRIMLYKGVIKPEELVDENKPSDEMTVQDITKLYGLANWYRYQGNAAKADELCAKVLQTKNWEGFAYAGAEVDLQGK